jgi:hypothetical protein
MGSGGLARHRHRRFGLIVVLRLGDVATRERSGRYVVRGCERCGRRSSQLVRYHLRDRNDHDPRQSLALPSRRRPVRAELTSLAGGRSGREKIEAWRHQNVSGPQP